MIIRARPKYLAQEDIESLQVFEEEPKDETNGFYFSRGSSALKFVLENLISFLKKDITVCMQSFNCQTVLEAALEVDGVKILLSDIKLEDFSVSLEFLKNKSKDIDVLFLLHYQGLINKEYSELINFCKSKSIIVIEDLAHILEGTHDFQGDFGIYSYAFDKPITSFSGGKVDINYDDNDFVEQFTESYKKLDCESDADAEKDLKSLSYFMYSSKENLFKENLDNRNFVNLFIDKLSKEKILKILSNRFFYFSLRVLFKINSKLFKKTNFNNYKIIRLHAKKIKIIKMQQEKALKLRSEKKILQNEIIEKLIKTNIVNSISMDAYWNRISFIPKNRDFLSSEIQYGNFNWPTPLHVMFANEPKVNVEGGYENTDLASKEIVNFPCWSEKILDHLESSH